MKLKEKSESFSWDLYNSEKLENKKIIHKADDREIIEIFKSRKFDNLFLLLDKEGHVLQGNPFSDLLVVYTEVEFEQMETVLVSMDGEEWYNRFYLAKVDNCHKCCDTSLQTRVNIWTYIKPIK